MDHHYHSLNSGSEFCFYFPRNREVSGFLPVKSINLPRSYNMPKVCIVDWHSLPLPFSEVWNRMKRACNISSAGKIVTRWMPSSLSVEQPGAKFLFLLARLVKSNWKAIPVSSPLGFSRLKALLCTAGKKPPSDLNSGFIKKDHVVRLLCQKTSHSLYTINHLLPIHCS
jgi:hypothetical protein